MNQHSPLGLTLDLRLFGFPAAALPMERSALDFGKFPSAGSGPELVEGSRAAHRGWAGEMSGHVEQPAWLSDLLEEGATLKVKT